MKKPTKEELVSAVKILCEAYTSNPTERITILFDMTIGWAKSQGLTYETVEREMSERLAFFRPHFEKRS